MVVKDYINNILKINLEAMLVPDELFPPNFTPSFDPSKGIRLTPAP